MLKFAANISFMFQEIPFLDRFQAAKECGFKGVEYTISYEYDAHEIAQHLRHSDLELVMFNAPVGDLSAGEIGIGALPHKKDEFKASIEKALLYAREQEAKRIHVLSGIVPTIDEYENYMQTYIENLRYAATKFAPHSITLFVEPLNARRFPGYLIQTVKQARDVIEAVGLPNVALQFDCYHVQITEGNLATRFIENFNLIKHIQIAGVPERHEPNIGEINYPYLFDIFEKSGYSGWIGCEYNPKTTVKAGLSWLPIKH